VRLAFAIIGLYLQYVKVNEKCKTTQNVSEHITYNKLENVTLCSPPENILATFFLK